LKYYKKIIAVLMMFSVLTCALCGCDVQSMQEQESSEEFMGLESEPDLNYEVPRSTVGILVNQVGYKPKEDKIIIFRGKEIPDTFTIISVSDGKRVYEGNVEEEDGIGYGDFTEFEQEGLYRIYCDKLGNSYSFEIKENLYTEWSETYFNIVRVSFRDDNISMEKTLAMLLFSYELSPDVFLENAPDSEGILDARLKLSYEITENLLKRQQDDGNIAGNNIDETLLFAGCMTKFSYLYQQYDNQYAGQCLKAADQAWRKAKADIISQPDAEYDSTYVFFAASELFRKTGAYQYHSEAKAYMQQYEKFELENDIQLVGLMTYLSTKRRVDISLCNKIMKQIMTVSEDISRKSKDSPYMVSREPEENMDEFLWDMVILAISDSVLSTKEYATVLEDHVHYLLGRNPSAVSYLTIDGSDCVDDTIQIEKELERSIAFLFLLSNIV